MKASNKKNTLTCLLIGYFSILLFLVIVLALVFIPLYREYSAYQVIHAEQMSRLRTLLCEEIQLGMTKEQVISILEQKGELRINGKNDNLGFIYMDPTLQEYYGPFDIVIDNNIYVSSSVSTGFERYEIICAIDKWWAN